MIIRTDKDRNEFISRCLKIDLNKKPWEFTAKPWQPKRSVEQNSLSHMWYAEIGEQAGMTPLEVKNYCKWTYGCPILAAADSHFSEVYGSLMDKYEYEQCVAMMEFIEVTSSNLMTVKQMTEYMKHIEMYAIEQGYSITKPVDKYTMAMGKEWAEQHNVK